MSRQRKREGCTKVEGLLLSGEWYLQSDDGGFEHVSAAAVGAQADYVLCRREADFPGGQAPRGGTVEPCARCRAPIVVSPTSPSGVDRVCFQCAGITPLPL